MATGKSRHQPHPHMGHSPMGRNPRRLRQKIIPTQSEVIIDVLNMLEFYL